MINTWAWCGWLVSAVVLLSMTRNPAYLILLFICVTIVSTSLIIRRNARPGFFSPLPFLVFICLTAAIFNGATSHFGSTVLFTIPGKVPLISGNVTLEALAYGAINGMVLGSFFVTFTVVNQALPTRSLILLIPRAFFPLAVVVSIAVTFYPSTRRQMELIREAQMVRGHRIRGVRDYLPLVLPLLIGGLERAFQLAEAMTSRGFSGEESAQTSGGIRLAMLFGMVLVFSGWLLGLFPAAHEFGLSLLIVGTILIIGMLFWVSRRSSRTTYRTERWLKVDIYVLAGAALALAGFLVPRLLSFSVGTNYNPYPTLALPAFNPWSGLALLGLLTPAVILLAEPI